MRGRANASKQARRLLKQYLTTRGQAAEGAGYSTDVEGIAEHLGIDVVEYDFSDSISGVYCRKGEKQFLGVNKRHHRHRRRFTIAHEIGHYILHTGEVLHYDVGPDSENKFLFRAADVESFGEVEANQFAAELLMPEDKVRQLVDSGTRSVEELAGKFDVSADAMRYRLINLGYL